VERLNLNVPSALDDAAVTPFVAQARRLMDSGRTALAQDLLRSLILLAPRAVSAWELLARCHERTREPEVARLLRSASSAISAYKAEASSA
jgi:hypothetical protein